MLWSQLLLTDRQGTLEQRLSLLVLALRTVKRRKCGCIPCYVQMLCSLLLFAHLVRSL